MHLGLITPEWSPADAGGIGTYARTVAISAARLGHRVTVLAAATGEQAGGAAWPSRVPGVQVRAIPVRGQSAAAQAVAFRDSLHALCAEGHAPDVVEAPDFCGPAALAAGPDVPPLVTRLHTPLTVLLHRNDGQRIYRDDRERCELEEIQIRRSALVSSPSAWLAREVSSVWALPDPPVVVPNPVAGIRAPRPWTPRRAGPPHLVYVGRLEYRKGVLVLAEALRRWLDGGGAVRVTLVGGDTRWRQRSMRSRIEELLAPHHARFLEHLPPVARDAVLDDAHLVVLPSLYENFPYTCLEAMARGRPVLATSGSGYDEIIEHDRTGLLVPAGDAGALAAMFPVVQDTARLVTVGAAAARAVRRFDADPVVGELLGAYLRSTVVSGGPT